MPGRFWSVYGHYLHFDPALESVGLGSYHRVMTLRP
jgi:hypothetical protein